MPRLLFEKTGNAVWMSHLDLMRLFQRAFKRAGLPLTHTQGFNPRPSVSIALPLSVGVESFCEILEYQLEGETIPNKEITARLNQVLVDGVRVVYSYDNCAKLKNLAYLDCKVELEYDAGIPEDAVRKMETLFTSGTILVTKKSKNGTADQDIAPMIRKIQITAEDSHVITILARVCCQNPTLNPAQLVAALSRYLPELTPDFSKCSRIQIYDVNENIFR